MILEDFDIEYVVLKNILADIPSILHQYFGLLNTFLLKSKVLSGNTHFLWLLHCLFLLLLRYFLLHPPILSLNIICTCLQASLIISEHCIDFPFTFSYSSFPLFFHLLFWHLCQMDSKMDFTYDPYVYFYLHLYLYFYLHFLCYCVSPSISGVLVFISHIVIGHPPAGLHPFLLGSPARCINYCSLNVQIY